MLHDQNTFRDHLLSIYQSAAERHARATASTPLTAPVQDTPLASAVSRIATLRAAGATAIPETAPVGFGGQAWTCARLGLALLEAEARGNQSAVAQLKSELQDSACDLGWTETLIEYAKYFGPDGTRRAIPYVTPASAGEWIVEIASDARIALIADWGTGTAAAEALLRQVKTKQPTILIHLGDIYYSGTSDECERHFRQIVDTVFDRANTPLPVFTMTGNHDMYSGGDAYYSLIGSLNQGPARQKSSFFCLRAANKAWQVLAMDTGLHDYDPMTVDDALTFLDPDEEAWHLRRIAELKGGKTILLSHHQLFSAFSRIGPIAADGSFNPCNPNLLASLRKFQAAGDIGAWFWGHEHNQCVYQPYAGLPMGRCIGHGAIPVFADANPYAVPPRMRNPPGLLPGAELNTDGAIYAHGFAMISLNANGGPATVDYYQSTAADEPMYHETIG